MASTKRTKNYWAKAMKAVREVVAKTANVSRLSFPESLTELEDEQRKLSSSQRPAEGHPDATGEF